MKKYKNPIPVVDIIIAKGDKIVLIKRGIAPFKYVTAIPGGHVDYNERVEKAAVREALEETGLRVKLKDILGVYSDPRRDPRYHTIATVFLASPLGGTLKGDSDALEARWASLKEVRQLIKEKKLRFDHSQILSDYLKWRRAKKGTWWSGKK